jgi:hypothetical protein
MIVGTRLSGVLRKYPLCTLKIVLDTLTIHTYRVSVSKGRPTQTLTTEEIERLENFRRSERKTFSELNAIMDNPFSAEVLKRALGGRPVWDLNHAHIVNWIERNLAAKPISEGDRNANV